MAERAPRVQGFAVISSFAGRYATWPPRPRRSAMDDRTELDQDVLAILLASDVWIGDDGRPLDYLPERETRIGGLAVELTTIVAARVSALSRDLAAQNTRIAAVEALADEWEHPAEVYALRVVAGPRIRAALSASDPGQDAPCGSCGKPASHQIILRGQRIPACLRHTNHWRTPSFDYTCPTLCVEVNHPGREHLEWLGNTVCIAHGRFLPCHEDGAHRWSSNPFWVKSVDDYQGSAVEGLTWEPAWERPVSDPGQDKGSGRVWLSDKSYIVQDDDPQVGPILRTMRDPGQDKENNR